jgi:uncharacterized RDD family membrane protein YckC
VAKLIINPTASNRRELALSREGILTIGRDPSNDLVLPDAMVSRRHAVIEQRGTHFFLRDCNSANGSVVNGDRVSERGLRDGDLVAIGSMRLLFREEPAEPGAKVVPHPSAAPMQCPSCGGDYRRGDLYCRECGVQVAKPSGPPKAVCTSCGTAVPLPARFCNACGAGLAPSEPGSEPEPPEVAEPADPVGAGEGERHSKDTRPVPRPAATKSPGGRLGDSAARAPALPPEAPLPRAPGEPSPRVPPAAQMETPVAQMETPVARMETPSPPRVRRSTPPRPARRPPSPNLPAGFGSRCAAGLVDAVFVLSGQAVILAPVAYYWWSRELPRTPGEVPFLPIVATVGLLTLAVLLGVLYHVYSWGVRGSSPGKELLELRVEAEDGTCPIGLGRAGLRMLGYLLSAASFGIGFLMIASGGDGLHDRIAGTRVVRRSRR